MPFSAPLVHSMSVAARARADQLPAAPVRVPVYDDFVEHDAQTHKEYLAILEPIPGDSADVRTVLLARTKALEARALGDLCVKFCVYGRGFARPSHCSENRSP